MFKLIGTLSHYFPNVLYTVSTMFNDSLLLLLLTVKSYLLIDLTEISYPTGNTGYRYYKCHLLDFLRTWRIPVKCFDIVTGKRINWFFQGLGQKNTWITQASPAAIFTPYLKLYYTIYKFDAFLGIYLPVVLEKQR